MRLTAVATAVIASLCLAIPARAHHSFSMFDHDKTITLSGMVKEFEWTNPHAWIHIMATDEKSGKPVEWSFEMGSVGQIAAQGWKPDSIKPGDKIAVMMHPLKDGSHGGQYVSATLPDGRSFRNVQDNGRATNNVIQ
jgi:Family of unknown function (DUF6152)